MIRLSTGNWELKDIEAVIFDKDGTFIDLHKFWGKITELRALEIIKNFNLTKDSFNEICLFLGYNYESKKMISNGITAMYSRSEIIKILKEKLEQSYNIQISTNKIASIFDMISEHFYKNMFEYTETIESAINFIKKLYNKNIKLGIVTSDSIISTKKTLKYFNLEYLFDVIVGREASQETKESGIPTTLAIKELNIPIKNIIMVGDAPMDVISAQNAGIEQTILVASGQIPIETLKKHSSYTIDNLENIEISDN